MNSLQNTWNRISPILTTQCDPPIDSLRLPNLEKLDSRCGNNREHLFRFHDNSYLIAWESGNSNLIFATMALWSYEESIAASVFHWRDFCRSVCRNDIEPPQAVCAAGSTKYSSIMRRLKAAGNIEFKYDIADETGIIGRDESFSLWCADGHVYFFNNYKGDEEFAGAGLFCDPFRFGGFG